MLPHPGSDHQNTRIHPKTTDSVEAVKYKAALKDSLTILQTAKGLGKVEERKKINIAATVDVTYKALNPAITIPKNDF